MHGRRFLLKKTHKKLCILGHGWHWDGWWPMIIQVLKYVDVKKNIFSQTYFLGGPWTLFWKAGFHPSSSEGRKPDHHPQSMVGGWGGERGGGTNPFINPSTHLHTGNKNPALLSPKNKKNWGFYDDNACKFTNWNHFLHKLFFTVRPVRIHSSQLGISK